MNQQFGQLEIYLKHMTLIKSSQYLALGRFLQNMCIIMRKLSVMTFMFPQLLMDVYRAQEEFLMLIEQFLPQEFISTGQHYLLLYLTNLFLELKQVSQALSTKFQLFLLMGRFKICQKLHIRLLELLDFQSVLLLLELETVKSSKTWFILIQMVNLQLIILVPKQFEILFSL